MMIMVSLLAASAFVEFVLYIAHPLWLARKVLVPLCFVAVAFASGGLLAWQFSAMSVVVALLSAYRLLNYVRMLEARMHDRYLYRATRRTGMALMLLQLGTALAWAGWHTLTWPTHVLWGLLAAAQLGLAVVLLAATIRRLRKTLPTEVKRAYSDAELPSVSVAIPARNETEDLEACLRSLIASDYPKLEIIVLDDCSQLRRTPEIIRSFAHDGVRFVQGAEPSDTWLPKNQAYQRLSEEASGDYIMFCGVDTRFEPTTVRNLVTTMLARQKSMISILPQRGIGVQHMAIVQAMRYWWELAPPRRLLKRPPVMSSCWMIAARELKRMGGFAAITRSIVPEAFFARQLIRTDGYAFLRSDGLLGVTSVKTATEQRATATRMRYPQLHRRPEIVFALAMCEAGLLLLPYTLAIGGFWWHVGVLAQVLATAAAILLSVTFTLVVAATRVGRTLLAPFAFPVVVFVDIGMLHYSMWQYEFSTVDWKGRNICIPVMHVVPHLPKL